MKSDMIRIDGAMVLKTLQDTARDLRACADDDGGKWRRERIASAETLEMIVGGIVQACMAAMPQGERQ